MKFRTGFSCYGLRRALVILLLCWTGQTSGLCSQWFTKSHGSPNSFATTAPKSRVLSTKRGCSPGINPSFLTTQTQLSHRFIDQNRRRTLLFASDGDDISKCNTGNKEDKTLSPIQRFLLGGSLVFRDLFFLKVQVVSVLVLVASYAIGKAGEKVLPSAFTDFVSQTFQLSFRLGMFTVGNFVTITSGIPQIVSLAVLGLIIYVVLKALSFMPWFGKTMLDRLVTVVEGSAKSSTRSTVPAVVKYLAVFLYLARLCVIVPFAEELTFRSLSPRVLYGAFVRPVQRIQKKIQRRGREHQEAEDAGTEIRKREKLGKQRACDNVFVTTICSCLFAVAHLETARQGAEVMGASSTSPPDSLPMIGPDVDMVILASAVNRYLVATFWMAQQLLVPAFAKHGFMAAWGAHASFNGVAIIIRVVLGLLFGRVIVPVMKRFK